ncbi:MAG: CBS domain-containing protein, partial [Oceanospirillaceae bacterium]|nr:CBS domain-containing protein [Oceanospirillaceae bacterium]
SEIDCLRAILDGSYYNEVGGTVSDFMSLEIDSVTKHVDFLAVAKRMVDDRRRRIPIVENGKFIGQLSERSILKAIKDFDVPEDKSEL